MRRRNVWPFAMLVASSLIAEVSGAGNRVWPADAPLDTTSVSESAEAVCERSLPREVEELDRRKAYPSQAAVGVPGGEGGVLAWFLSMRGSQDVGPSKFATVVERCGSDMASACSQGWQDYFIELCWPFAVPAALGVICVALHCVCCYVACCRCCRRMVCCRERQEVRYATKATVIASLAFWALASAGIFGLGISVHEFSIKMNIDMNWHLCVGIQLASDAVAGTRHFLGTETSFANLQSLALAIDVDGTTMRTIDTVVNSTSGFAAEYAAFKLRVSHFTSVLNKSGPAFRTFEHRCVFCSLAVGDVAHTPLGYPSEGLLPALTTDISQSSAEAMDVIRQFTMTQLTGTQLGALASTVKRALGAIEILDTALRSALINIWVRYLPSLDTVEAIRLAIFATNGICAMGGAVIGWLAFALTRYRLKVLPDFVPSGKVHCCTWCCGFCYANVALMLGGGLLALSVTAGEGCQFLRQDLGDYDGLARYAPALGLVPLTETGITPSSAVRQAQAKMAVNLTSACFTPGGSGDILGVMDLDQPLAFQPSLTDAFYDLDERATDAPIMANALLDQLAEAAEAHGNLFVLDPLPLGVNASNDTLGILELSANVEDLLLGSSINPEDTKGPDGFATIRGLNTYAGLIAGPGKYTFIHGTAGGGFVIEADKPTDAELASLPSTVRNALLYARAKEQLLASSNALRCDDLHDNGQIIERYCSVSDFHQYVKDEVVRIKSAAQRASTLAEAVESLFQRDLRLELLPTLRKVRELRELLGCRVLRRRYEEFDQSFCEALVPTVARGSVQLLVLACFAALGIFVQYKVWRHLKDNKVVKYETERFEQRLALFERKFQDINDERRQAENPKRAQELEEERNRVEDDWAS